MSQQKKLLLLLLLGILAWWLWQDGQASKQQPANPAPNQPVNPTPPPKKPDDNKKKPKRPSPPRPWGPRQDSRSAIEPVWGKPQEGGRTSPDGKVQLVCDLPESERKKNIASQGLGCCVFRSAEYAGRWQNIPLLYDLPEKMVKANIPGGGYPEKVDKVLAQLAPGVKYGQDTSGDPEILEAVLKSGRMPCVTYNGHDCHYGGSIAHMVCLPYFDRSVNWACVSDNNFIKENQFVWQTCDDFTQRWKGSGGGWVLFFLSPPPPPVPYN